MWLNLPVYEVPSTNPYPKNPFSIDRTGNKVHYALQPGAFNVGIKFQGKAKDMLKLVCLTLIHIEVEW